MTVARKPLERSPTLPSAQIRDLVLEEYGVTQDELAKALEVSLLSVNQLVNSRRSITPDMALRLEAVSGVSAEHWLALQQNYDLWHARRDGGANYAKLRRLSPRREGVKAS